jgi:hypothetical protein
MIKVCMILEKEWLLASWGPGLGVGLEYYVNELQSPLNSASDSDIWLGLDMVNRQSPY